ncbi:hypothetical protein BH09MYX1_BH09MYX1_32240 [soil metagenome]
MDERIFRAIYGGTTTTYPIYALMVGLTVVGSGWSMIAFLPFVILRRTRRMGAWLLATLVATSLVVFLAKMAVHRARPCATLGDVHALCFTAPRDPSFPSGHSAGAFAFATFLATIVVSSSMRRRTKMLAAASLGVVALGIALSRIYLGVHFPSDVAAGAVIGTILGHLGARLARKPLDRPVSP